VNAPTDVAKQYHHRTGPTPISNRTLVGGWMLIDHRNKEMILPVD